jgi:hypothetical protein
MKILIDVPDTISPDKFNGNSVEQRKALTQAFKRGRKVIKIKETQDIFKAAMDFYKTDNFEIYVTDKAMP